MVALCHSPRFCRSLLVVAMVFTVSTARAEEKIELVEGFDWNPEAFAFTDIQNDGKSLADYDGQFVVVNFWATWCAPCVAELPSLDQFAKHYEENNLVVLPIAQEFKAIEELESFFDNLELTALTPYKDQKSVSFRAAKGRGLPTSLVIDRDGTLLARIEGEIDWMAPGVLERFDVWLENQEVPAD